ncbi:GL26914 [Drosophila persimilis]|uniref:GL26914 n=1 Tax=Drosophila persimilis TaxID=7234 RepID=B4H2V6_DROPE|nr:GL26914 [Drosophila persimilis]
MALFPSSSRPRTLMEQLLARKIEAAAAAAGGAPSTAVMPPSAGEASGSGSPMIAGMALVGAGGGASILSRLRRTDSLDSTSSLGSLAFGEDVCRCDDCLLGIVDLYVISAAEAAKKKKRLFRSFHKDEYGKDLCTVTAS